MNMIKRTLAMFLVLCMLIGIIPLSVFADETDSAIETEPQETTTTTTEDPDSDIAVIDDDGITLGSNGTVTGEPFDTGVSENYRIPGLVNHDGTLVAVADVRYNEEYDGGGIDIVVSTSADGNAWNYTIPAYLGDNGNTHAKNSSTLMDPLVISDGTNLYLFYDMFPAGYSLSGGDNTTYAFWATETGFDSQGRLRIGKTYNGSEWNHYLEDGKIMDSSDAETGYTVDAWFNVYQNDTYVSNLFFADADTSNNTESEFYAYPTSYIAMQKSTDGGSSWTTPKLLNIKHDNIKWQVLGPGSGLITQANKLAFTVYNSDSSISLVYGDGENWSTVKTSAATNESSIVELADGTIRAFVKNSNDQICYVDFTKTDSGYTAGGMTNTGRPSQSWCMVSSMLYSKTLGGKPVILVTCPTSSSGRYNGKMHLFTLNDNNTMNYVDAYEINGASNFFAYSDMAELADGTIALLYEDDCKYYNWTDGQTHASHITYTTVDLEDVLDIEFDSTAPHVADSTGAEIKSTINLRLGTAGTYTIRNIPTGGTATAESADANVVTAAVNGSALTLTPVAEGQTKVTVTVSSAATREVTSENGTTTIELDVVVKDGIEVKLYVGETKQIVLDSSVADGSHTSDAADVVWGDTSVTKTYLLAGIGTDDTSYTAGTMKLDDCLYTFTTSGNGFIVESKANPGIYLNTIPASSSPNATVSRPVIVANGTSEGTFYLYNINDSGDYTGYLYFWRDGKNRFDRNSGVHDSCLFNLYRPAEADETSSTEIPGYVKVTSVTDGAYLVVAYYENSYYVLRPSTETGSSEVARRSHVAKVTSQTTTETVESSAITITGKAAGTTKVTIDGTKYNITVEQFVENVTLYVGESKTYTIDGAAYTDANISVSPDSSIATMTVTGKTIADSKELVEITSLDQFVSGKSYLITTRNGMHVLTDEAYSSTSLKVGDVYSVDSTELWTFTATNDGTDGLFAIGQGGKFLNIANNSITMGTTAQSLKIYRATYNGETHWIISDGNDNALNNYGQTNVQAAEYSPDAGGLWRIYEIVSTEGSASTDVTFTGVGEGTTEAVVGNTKYNISVSYYEEDVTAFVGAAVTVTPNGNVTEDDINDFNEANDGKVTVALVDGKLAFTGVAAAEEFTAVLGNTRYSITVIANTVDITLYEGVTGTFIIDGYSYTTGTIVDENSATLDKVEEKVIAGSKRLVQITSEDQIVSGKSYLIVTKNNKSVLTATAKTATALNIGDIATVSSTELWKFTGSDGSYTISPADGTYLNLAHDTGATVTSTSQELTVEWLESAAAWTIAGTGTNKYLNNDGNTNTTAATWYEADAGSQWYLYEIVSDEDKIQTEVTFTGVKAGTTTTAQVGHVTYNITVKETEEISITLYVGVTQNDFIDGFSYDNTDSIQPDNTYAYIHSVTTENGGTKVVFSGVAATPEGQTITATVGHVVYKITVKDLHSGDDVPGYSCVIAEGEYASGSNELENMNGREVKSLRMTAGAEFNLGVDITDADSVVWKSSNSDIATVDDTGKVTAVAEGVTLVTAEVTKDGVTEYISVHVTVVPSMVEGLSDDEIGYVIYYINQVYNTDPFYTMFLSTANTTGPVEDHTMIMVMEGEVLCYERPKNAAFALVWTADPWDGYALTTMAATNTRSEYFPLQSSEGVLGSGGIYYKGSTPYNNIINFGNDAGSSWQAGMDDLLECNVHVGEDIWDDFGCDGAMSMSRRENDDYPNVAASLSFISEKLPEVTKSVNGVLPSTTKTNDDGEEYIACMFADWEVYHDGIYARVGDFLYFTINVRIEAPHAWELDANNAVVSDDNGPLAALKYNIGDSDGDATLTDMLTGAYFYTKELDGLDGDRDGNGVTDNDGYIVDTQKEIDGETVVLKTNAQVVTDELNRGWTQEEIDAGYRELEYYVVYRIQDTDLNKQVVNTVELDYTYKSTYSNGVKEDTSEAQASLYVLGESLQDLVIDFGLPVSFTITRTESAHFIDVEKSNNAQGGCLYGTVSVVQTVGADTEATNDDVWTVTYTPNKILQNYDVVYLMDSDGITVRNFFRVYPATTVYYEEGFLFAGNVTGNWAGNTNKGKGEQKLELLDNKTNVFGYDSYYADDNAGSDGTATSSTAVGDKTVFTFTGTGFELYANSMSGSGYVTLYSEGKLSKIYMIDTRLTDVDGNAMEGTYYSLPIISEKNLPHGEYTVYLMHSNDSAPISIDGIRIINTIEDSNIFLADEEDNPVFYELRDYVLNAIGVEDLKTSDYINPDDPNDPDDYDNRIAKVKAVKDLVGQVYNAEVVGQATIFTREDISLSGADAQKLLDNGPKNELYLYPGQTLAFKVTTNRVMQLGLKSPVGNAKFNITVTAVDSNDNAITYTADQLSDLTRGEITLGTTVDMFYKIADKVPSTTDSDGNTVENKYTYTVIISVPANTTTTEGGTTDNGVLSVTDLKICDDPNFTFNNLTEKDVEDVLMGIYGLNNEETPDEPENPFEDVAEDAFYYDAVLWAVEQDITNGTDATHFSPNAVCNRAQVVTFLYRTFAPK